MVNYHKEAKRGTIGLNSMVVFSSNIAKLPFNCPPKGVRVNYPKLLVSENGEFPLMP